MHEHIPVMLTCCVPVFCQVNGSRQRFTEMTQRFHWEASACRSLRHYPICFCVQQVNIEQVFSWHVHFPLYHRIYFRMYSRRPLSVAM